MRIRGWRVLGTEAALTPAGSFGVCSFFFSSRRRHTRFDCDWSSDVCSSDLGSSGGAIGLLQGLADRAEEVHRAGFRLLTRLPLRLGDVDGHGEADVASPGVPGRSEEHTSELQSQSNLVCRLLLEKKKTVATGGLWRPSSRRACPYECTPLVTGSASLAPNESDRRAQSSPRSATGVSVARALA